MRLSEGERRGACADASVRLAFAPIVNRAFPIILRCVGALLLLALAYFPAGEAGASKLDAGEGAGWLNGDEDCPELVSVDMVTCGTDLFDGYAIEPSLMQMPREVCEELLAVALDLECDPGDSECEARRLRRGDAAPVRQLVRAMAPFVVGRVEFPPLDQTRGRRLSSEDSHMPESWSLAPPHGPPQWV